MNPTECIHLDEASGSSGGYSGASEYPWPSSTGFPSLNPAYNLPLNNAPQPIVDSAFFPSWPPINSFAQQQQQEQQSMSLGTSDLPTATFSPFTQPGFSSSLTWPLPGQVLQLPSPAYPPASPPTYSPASLPGYSPASLPTSPINPSISTSLTETRDQRLTQPPPEAQPARSLWTGLKDRFDSMLHSGFRLFNVSSTPENLPPTESLPHVGNQVSQETVSAKSGASGQNQLSDGVSLQTFAGMALFLYLTACVLRLETQPTARVYDRAAYPNWNPIARRAMKLTRDQVADHKVPLAQHHDVGNTPIRFFLNLFSEEGKPGKFMSVEELRSYIPTFVPQSWILAEQQGRLIGGVRAGIERNKTWSNTFNLLSDALTYNNAIASNPHLFGLGSLSDEPSTWMSRITNNLRDWMSSFITTPHTEEWSPSQLDPEVLNAILFTPRSFHPHRGRRLASDSDKKSETPRLPYLYADDVKLQSQPAAERVLCKKARQKLLAKGGMNHQMNQSKCEKICAKQRRRGEKCCENVQCTNKHVS